MCPYLLWVANFLQKYQCRPKDWQLDSEVTLKRSLKWKKDQYGHHTLSNQSGNNTLINQPKILDIECPVTNILLVRGPKVLLPNFFSGMLQNWMLHLCETLYLLNPPISFTFSILLSWLLMKWFHITYLRCTWIVCKDIAKNINAACKSISIPYSHQYWVWQMSSVTNNNVTYASKHSLFSVWLGRAKQLLGTIMLTDSYFISIICERILYMGSEDIRRIKVVNHQVKQSI